MTNLIKYQQKNIFIVIFSSILLFAGIYISTYFSDRVKTMYLDVAIEEMEYDMNFFGQLLQDLYKNNDFVGIENILSRWTKDNNMDTKIEVIAANGYRIFFWEKIEKPEYIWTAYHDINLDNKKILTIKLTRDISSVLSAAAIAERQSIYVGISLSIVFGVLIFVFLNRYAFKPLEEEIELRRHAEKDLLDTNNKLELRVLERTAEIYRLSSVVEQTDDIVIITDAKGLVTYVNPSFSKISGYDSHEILGKNISAIKSGMHDNEFYQRLWNTITNGESFREVFINRGKSGKIYYEEKTITPLKDENNTINYFVSTGKDISDQVETQKKMNHLATHDVLTGLPNRIMLEDRLTHACHQARRSNKKVAVLFFDLDRFKEVNDSLGHAIGDQFLNKIAQKISDNIRSDDTLSRFGGDEFVLVMESIENIDVVEIVAKKILKLIAEPIFIDNYEILSSASIGITIFPDDSNNKDDLLKNADVAMYRAKGEGGSRFEYFTRDMSEAAYRRMEMQNMLSHALENDEFVIYYQPKIHLLTGAVSGMESLIRWQHPQRGLVMPDEFISLQEESGMIVNTGKWVMENACRFNRKLREMGYSPMRVSINLSAKQFSDPDLIPFIKMLCEKNDRTSDFMEFEITESLLIKNFDTVISTLKEIHALGIHISIDDFGTGYSSLGYLKRLPIDSLKIDRSFISDLPEDKDDSAIIDAIIALANSLGIKTVAEGVENLEQIQLLQEKGCNDVQGYFISKPLCEDDFIDFLDKHPPHTDI